MQILQGLNGRTYSLGEKLGEGGEGTVYSLPGDSGRVAKVYKAEHFKDADARRRTEEKLKVMLAMNMPNTVDGKLALAWPQDILYENGRMAGFVMPSVNVKYKIYDIYRNGKKRDAAYPEYNFKYAVQMSYNLAAVVNHLHQQGIVIGDMNPNNIVVDVENGGMVVLVDCDSFDITDRASGQHYSCVVAYNEVLAPELQSGTDTRKARFTRQSDCFGMASHIFHLLLANCEPFSPVEIKTSEDSVGGITQREYILRSISAQSQASVPPAPALISI